MPRRGSLPVPRLTLRVAAKFLLVVAVLVPTLVGLTWIGIRGLDVLKGKVNSLYSQNLRVTEQSDQLARDLGQAEEVTLHEIIATDGVATALLRAQITGTIDPKVGSDLAALLKRRANGRNTTEHDQARALVVGWQRFLALQRSGAFDYSGPNVQAFNQRVADRVSSLFDTLNGEIGALIKGQVADAATARSHAVQTQRSTQDLLLWVALGCLLAVLGAMALMVRDVVPRLQGYSAFARRVADEDLTGRLEPRGTDELAELGFALNEMVDRREAQRLSTTRQVEFAAAMQVTESEDEAQELLRRHLERAVGDSSVVVLNRNNSDDRLEAATHVDEQSDLAPRLIDAKPRSCLAVRFARSQDQGPDLDPLVQCEVCGQLPYRSTCEPLIVSGQVIGSVLLSSPASVDENDKDRIRESVAQASPVLGNLRNLAIAERRAATDSLTGLPNKRAAQDTLQRMVAQASRAETPLAAALMDLDHFKRINDLYGHPKGDELLAMIGATLRSGLRASDFVARYGGEEFLILLPETTLEGAVTIAEKLRELIGELVLPEIDEAVTVSLGVAVFPDDANDTSTLVRHADRALYAAKRAGRNRVETFTRAVTVSAPD